MTGIHGSLWEMRAMPLLVHSVSGLHQLYPLAHYFSRFVGMVFDAIYLRNWLKLNWTHDCTFLCEVEDERSNSQFVCILSGSTKNQRVALVFKGHSRKNLFSSHSASTMDLNLFSAYQFC